ncbi:DNA-binding response regulator [Streptomyces lichenis]|uniref:DNA-binding response regulator n=1 Tax=Streptomyces lichenis TaxID=2306967 RepID=A0ABT0I5F1_9ACTN|nr:DNA-binding response regulator [Streptomyces lichenis]MCK8676512.1 DNA-binding response regulator [Streptomyces lichenis]
MLGTRQIGAALAALAESARRELLTFDDPAASPARSLPASFLQLAGDCARTAGERVPTVRRVLPRHARDALTALCGASGSGPPPGQARLTDSIPFKMILVDRTVAAVPLDLELLYNGMLLIRDPVVVQALVRAHQAWWESGEELLPHRIPLPGARAPGSGAGTGGEAGCAGPGAEAMPEHLRPVLDALLAGLTDEAAAARLGISGRTYTRRVGELFAALGTTSRFRAGAEAMRRGWL